MWCNRVRVACVDDSSVFAIPPGSRIRVGDSVGDGCIVAYANPRSCVVTPFTVIERTRFVKHSVEEYRENYVVELEYSGRRRVREVYVYPRKTWEEVVDRIVEPLSKGEPPGEAGAILIGPPGNGKTSMTNILALIHGLNVIDISHATIVSKYIGESSKNLEAAFNEAISSQPSMIRADDAEWILASRNLADASRMTGEAATREMLGLVQVLLTRLQEIYSKGHLVVFMATTNVSPRMIDDALLRSGRLGDPILVPYPNVEGVKILLERLGVDKVYRDVEGLARKIVAAGVPMSNVVSLARKLLSGKVKEPKIEAKQGRGYKRLIPPSLEKRLVHSLEKLRDIIPPRSLESPYTRYAMPVPRAVAEPLLAAYASYIANKPSIILSDARYYDEAMMTADVHEAIMVVDAEMIPEDIIRSIPANATVPVFFVAPGYVKVPAKPLPSLESISKHMGGLPYLAAIVLSYYNIRFDSVEQLARIDEKTLMELVRTARYYAYGMDIRDVGRQIGLRLDAGRRGGEGKLPWL